MSMEKIQNLIMQVRASQTAPAGVNRRATGTKNLSKTHSYPLTCLRSSNLGNSVKPFILYKFNMLCVIAGIKTWGTRRLHCQGQGGELNYDRQWPPHLGALRPWANLS